ncbi:hypothetical protein F4780DRAFT_58644 [Xylariomycetidae sp. FL0641]|nr:hypothetical protein F4780DRAFT_58644 [Xylariomycetidae sp. FL0641]
MALSSTPQSPSTFTRFNDLPPELRIKIWQYSIPEARTVVVKSSRSRPTKAPASLDEAMSQTYDTEKTWQSPTQIPALLHVNPEARHEALKHYRLSLGVGESQPRIFVDFSRDTVFFGNSELAPECSPLWSSTSDLSRVQYLAVVPEGAWRVLRWKKVDLDALEKITFVHDTENAQLGPLPQLMEDAQPVIRTKTEAEEQVETMEEAKMQDIQARVLGPMKKRMQEAREELDTLMMVLPTQWEKEPKISTAVFTTSQQARWIC